MKRVLTLCLCACVCLCALAACGPSAGQADQVRPLQVTDGRLCNDAGEPVQLRGVSTHGIAWYGESLNANAMQSVKEAGGNTIRIAMYTDGEGGYVSDPEGNTKQVICGIEDAIASDMYVIVDWHILNDGNPNAHLSEAITFFDAIASRYPNTPNVIYEICNEPNGVSWQEISQYAYSIIPVIRQYAPGAVILVGTPEYSSQLSYAWEAPIDAENLMYTWHYYVGMHPGYDVLREAVDRKVPVFVSEWGMGSENREAGESFLDYVNDAQVSWCAWSLCNKDEVYSLIRPDVTTCGGWTEDDLSENGKLIFEKMKG